MFSDSGFLYIGCRDAVDVHLADVGRLVEFQRHEALCGVDRRREALAFECGDLQLHDRIGDVVAYAPCEREQQSGGQYAEESVHGACGYFFL